MNIVESISEVRSLREGLGEPVGLVPTMGYLHEGHLSLIRRAKEECASVVVSIYVNPAQFGPREDLARYPRDIPRDLQMLRELAVDLVWIPTNQGMYPDGYQTWVTVERITERLEGEHRPGHFKGVATIVAKLFNVIQPQRAYFGQKDAQQVAVICQMVRDLNFPLEVVICPTIREPDGLAMSSRNVYLSLKERQAAVVLFRALSAARMAFEAGERDADMLRVLMRNILDQEPLARVQYISCADPDTLDELIGKISRGLLSMAVFIGNTRLIDNMIVGD